MLSNPDPGPATFPVAVDLVVLTVADRDLLALAIRRGRPPFEGQLALPGGFIHPDEDLIDAAARELAEETGIHHVGPHLEQLATYGHPDRDPRGRVLTVAYLALVADPGTPAAGSDAAEARWLPVADLLDTDVSKTGKLAFDHRQILTDGVERARAKLEYSPLATAFCPPEFTINELREVYETVWGTRLDPRNFHRKVTNTEDFVVSTGSATTRGGGRPAQLYRTGTTRLLHPAMLRPAT